MLISARFPFELFRMIHITWRVFMVELTCPGLTGYVVIAGQPTFSNIKK